MYCVKKITDDLTWVGGDDRRLAMFEGVYSVPTGVSYNSYLMLDEKTVLFDTVDRAVSRVFFENIEHVLAGRELDYLVIQHMEPDHSATLGELLLRYPGVTVVCNRMISGMVKQFFDVELGERAMLVAEGDKLCTGRHTLAFYMAPMVHWPEVMVTYDEADGVLFSADAFGCFGALNGAIFGDEVDFMAQFLPEARRYYTNIVGKYGPQVTAMLAKAAGLNISIICPLHGFVHRSGIADYVEKYRLWSSYTPEEKGVMIAYASVYGNTENAAEILACRLRDKGVPVKMFDVSVTPASEILADAFRASHLVFASTTYNAGVFVSMEELLRDIAAHNLQNRTMAFIENGSWAPASGKLMREILAPLKGMRVLEQTLSIRSSLKEEQLAAIDALVDAIAADFPKSAVPAPAVGAIDNTAMFALSYGLFVLTSASNGRDNGCIINTVTQITDSPKRISIAVNKQNYTHDQIAESGIFNVSVLSEETPFKVFQHFGFQSGRSVDKFADCKDEKRTANGLLYLPKYANAVLSARVINSIDCGTHTVFIADVTEALKLSSVPSATYAYYFANIKPKPAPKPEEGKKKGFICRICGYVYEGDTLPPDFVCPICKHGAEAFDPIV